MNGLPLVRDLRTIRLQSRRAATARAAKPKRGSIEDAIRIRLSDSRKALVPYFTAGFPDSSTFIALLREATDIGCDAIEVGIPFSDPIADGPTIQFASQHALDRGTTTAAALEAIAKARVGAPIIVMGYLNPILAYGMDRFVRDARSAGVAGLIVPDAPLSAAIRRPDEGEDPSHQRMDEGLDLAPLATPWEQILMAAPTTSPRRLSAIGRSTRGFMYAVTVTGITGARSTLPSSTIDFLHRARRSTRRPVLAGFGIGDAGTARKITPHCDGVIVGSALIERMRNKSPRNAVKSAVRLLKELRAAL